MKNNIITLQDLLSGRNEEFDEAAKRNKVKLIRHKDNRSEIRIMGKPLEDFTLYDLYKYERQTFLDYQREQSKPIYDNIDFIVTFLGESSKEARMIGVYKNNGKLNIPNINCDNHIYDLIEAEGFDTLKEKVIIDWGDATISWHQYYSNIKEVIRIEPGMMNTDGIPYFKSYSDININYEQLKTIIEREPDEWKKALQSVNAIYMIIDDNNGKQYIGSTYAQKGNKSGGIWNRWSTYIQTGGHGNNVNLKKILDENGAEYAKNFRWIIIHVR